MKPSLQYCLRVTIAVVIAYPGFALWASSAHAYATWSDGCIGCHGDFTEDNYVSATDGTNWGTDLMSGHSDFMGSGTCNVCHQPPSGTPRTPTYIGISAGIAGYNPISCLGCHGRAEDASSELCVSGNPATIDPDNCGMGAGLRLHHTNAGIDDCADCHSDMTPVGEDAVPVYYFTPDTTHPDKPINPCNAAASPGNENKFGATGLDNDGDGLYDQDDPDCEGAAACGDGIVSPGEDCDDGDMNWTPGEYCNAACGALDCGDTNDSGTLTASDALFILRAAVGTTPCDVSVCDASGNGTIAASDALLTLKAAVGQVVALSCPAPS